MYLVIFLLFFTYFLRLCGLVFLKILQVGDGVKESFLTSIDETGISIDLSDKTTKNASERYKRLLQLCLNEDVTSTTVEAFVRSISAYQYTQPNKEPTFIRVGSLKVEAEPPKYDKIQK